eukprot:gene11177-20118_t
MGKLSQLEGEISKVEDLSVYKSKFYAYLKEREKPVLRKVIQDAREKGGVPRDIDGKTERVNTDQSECVNSMLAAKKASSGFR